MTQTVPQPTEVKNTSENGKALVVTQGLKKHFPIRRGLLGRMVGMVQAVDGVDLTIHHGETVGLVGESGCGKSTFGRTLIRLYEPTAGTILFDEHDITLEDKKGLRNVRRYMQIIFQDPFSSMNPRMRVGKIIAEPLIGHGIEDSRNTIEERVVDVLERVELTADSIDRYPYEFSGGQRQRIAVARAIVSQPDFIICDEPVSSLDVSIRAQIINLLEDLQSEFGLTYLFISHDLAVVRHISDRVAVMYLGKIVELADRNSIYANAKHPYTSALLSAIPIPDPVAARAREIVELEGDIPSPAAPPSGCRFHTRCPIVELGLCDVTEPEFREIGPDHWVACHLV